jgi:hypothetical protein
MQIKKKLRQTKHFYYITRLQVFSKSWQYFTSSFLSLKPVPSLTLQYQIRTALPKNDLEIRFQARVLWMLGSILGRDTVILTEVFHGRPESLQTNVPTSIMPQQLSSKLFTIRYSTKYPTSDPMQSSIWQNISHRYNCLENNGPLDANLITNV